MQNNLQRTYNEITKSTKLKIEATEDSEIIGCKTDSLIEYFFFLNFFSPIEIDDKKPQTISKRTGFQIPQDVPKDLLDTKKDFTTESLIYFLPIKPNLRISEIIGFHPFKDSSKNIQWGTSDIQIVFPVKGYGFIKDEIQVASEVEIKRKLVVEWIEKINTQIINFNEYLRSEIKLCIEKRKKEIELNDEKYKNISKRINIPLQLKIDDTIQKIQLDTSPLIKNIKPSPNVVEEYILDRKKVLDIVHVLDNQGRQFEKTAMTYKSMYEEDLRNILLVSLNTVFEGKAVGEAFCNRGKTDIYLNIDRGNILIVECKIWKGKSEYISAINQLLSYLTWRNNYGILITFCRINNFLKLIGESFDFVGEISDVRNAMKRINDSHFISYHKLPSDESRNVEIHHVFYNLFTK